MANHNYVKLNETEYHLALGSFFRIIKEESNAKNSFLQSEFFCDIFEIDSIAEKQIEIFEQNKLTHIPNYTGATLNTPIKKFIYYKDPSNVGFTTDVFKYYIEGSKVNDENDILEIEVAGINE